MIERIVIIDNVDPVSFYGVNNSNMHLIRNLFPKLRMAARGSVIKVIGDDAETAEFERKIKELEEYCSRFNKLTEEVILDIVKGNAPSEPKQDDVIIYGINGKAISPRNANQALLVKAFRENDLTFALGPAGTGKTYIAIALAVKALKNKEVRKIILSRPAVEAGEKLGFLPGDMKDKIDPYLQPLYDALEDMIPAVKLKEYMETNVIQIAPLAFMRGRTLNDAVIVLDEAQNTTVHQIKMFLTRLGMNAKMIITGDATQIDLAALKMNPNLYTDPRDFIVKYMNDYEHGKELSAKERQPLEPRVVTPDIRKIRLIDFMKALGQEHPVAADGNLRIYKAPYDPKGEPTMVINIETNLWRDTKSGAYGGIYDLAYEMTGSANMRELNMYIAGEMSNIRKVSIRQEPKEPPKNDDVARPKRKMRL